MSPEPQMLIVGPRRGRPSRAGVPSCRRVEILVTEAEFDALKGIAADQRYRHVGAVVREAVNVFVADYGERRVFVSKPPFE
jgi:hypothetical protein